MISRRLRTHPVIMHKESLIAPQSTIGAKPFTPVDLSDQTLSPCTQANDCDEKRRQVYEVINIRARSFSRQI